MNVYGWSWKSWEDHYLVAFASAADAEKWLETEEYDFRQRELITEKKARELAGDYFDGWDLDYKLQLNG